MGGTLRSRAICISEPAQSQSQHFAEIRRIQSQPSSLGLSAGRSAADDEMGDAGSVVSGKPVKNVNTFSMFLCFRISCPEGLKTQTSLPKTQILLTWDFAK